MNKVQLLEKTIDVLKRDIQIEKESFLKTCIDELVEEEFATSQTPGRKTIYTGLKKILKVKGRLHSGAFRNIDGQQVITDSQLIIKIPKGEEFPFEDGPSLQPKQIDQLLEYIQTHRDTVGRKVTKSGLKNIAAICKAHNTEDVFIAGALVHIENLKKVMALSVSGEFTLYYSAISLVPLWFEIEGGICGGITVIRKSEKSIDYE